MVFSMVYQFGGIYHQRADRADGLTDALIRTAVENNHGIIVFDFAGILPGSEEFAFYSTSEKDLRLLENLQANRERGYRFGCLVVITLPESRKAWTWSRLYRLTLVGVGLLFITPKKEISGTEAGGADVVRFEELSGGVYAVEDAYNVLDGFTALQPLGRGLYKLEGC